METSHRLQYLRHILSQAHRFLNELKARIVTQKIVKADLEHSKTDREKERIKEEKKQEAMSEEAVPQMKDKRIQLLLNRTDSCMNELSERVRMSYTTAPKDGVPNRESKYEFGLKLPDDVTQPEDLNGKLKDCQVKGLQRLVGTYQSHLKGILADEIRLG
jgi:SNF2 family DNA or RNA helicase